MNVGSPGGPYLLYLHRSAAHANPNPMTTAFPLAAKVRFTQQRLSVLTPRDRQSLAGRIGTTQTDGALIRKPTVYFPTDGARLELRLFRVDPSHLERVEVPPEAIPAPDLIDSPAKADATPDAPDGGGTLSQSEMDNLFG